MKLELGEEAYGFVGASPHGVGGGQLVWAGHGRSCGCSCWRPPTSGSGSAAAANLQSTRPPCSRWPSQLAVVWFPTALSGRLPVLGHTTCPGLGYHRSSALPYPGHPQCTSGVCQLPHGRAWAPEPSIAARRHGWGFPGWGRRTPGVRLLPHGRARAPEPSIAARPHGWGYPGCGWVGVHLVSCCCRTAEPGPQSRP